MAVDKTKVASGPGTIRFIKDTGGTPVTVATFTGYENEFIKVTGSKKVKTRDLSDGTTEEWKSGQELAVEVTTDEIDLTVCAAFEAAQTLIDSVEIDWLNKGKPSRSRAPALRWWTGRNSSTARASPPACPRPWPA